MSLLPLSLNFDLSQALLLFLDTDRFLTLPLFDHLSLFDSGFFSLPLLFFYNSFLLFLVDLVDASLISNFFLVFLLDHLLVFDSSDPFLLDSSLFDGLLLDAFPLFFLLTNGLFTDTRLLVCDVADANPFFLHLP